MFKGLVIPSLFHLAVQACWDAHLPDEETARMHPALLDLHPVMTQKGSYNILATDDVDLYMVRVYRRNNEARGTASRDRNPALHAKANKILLVCHCYFHLYGNLGPSYANILTLTNADILFRHYVADGGWLKGERLLTSWLEHEDVQDEVKSWARQKLADEYNAMFTSTRIRSSRVRRSPIRYL